jgi:ribosomal-protein-alanine N-acetyltransferase
VIQHADVIASARLDLVLLTPAFMRAVADGDWVAAHRAQDFALPEDWGSPSMLKWVGRRLAQVEDDPPAAPWLMRLLVRRDDARVVGHITFHAPPDPAGRAELGYAVYVPYRRRGYATEAAVAMMAWATARGARRFVLSISPDNAPSLALAARLGFVRTGTQIDEEDGEEWVFERRPPRRREHDPIADRRPTRGSLRPVEGR